jgi:hypothetical protein
MYVREKKIRRGEGTWDKPWKVYSYWQLVEGHRVDGKVRQRVVAHIGQADDRKHADHIARRKGLLCSVEGCGRAWDVSDEGRSETIAGRKYRKIWRLCQEHHDGWRVGERIRGWPYMPELYGDGEG